jgi:hypothetical protein
MGGRPVLRSKRKTRKYQLLDAALRGCREISFLKEVAERDPTSSIVAKSGPAQSSELRRRGERDKLRTFCPRPENSVREARARRAALWVLAQ